ncbi:MAG: beta-eliminating lyase-related protein [Paracoccus sp. (in: a-proteobacteria)]|nr:beta-eliminating lyase-related protein [Paracoccus sp. (in: a-proteobacteria)]
MNFASDNGGAVHPAIMAAMVTANEGAVASYGDDPLTRAAEDRLREVFDAPGLRMFLTTTGTSANAISCAALCPPWGRIFCHEDAHIETSEAGAPEMFTAGAKLTLIPGEGGRIAPDALDRAARHWAGQGLHSGQNAMVSITNATEWGRIYRPDEVAEIAEVARRHGLGLHMDGARFANAVAATGAHPADLSHRAGVDILVFGGTKNGAMGVEAVLVFDAARAETVEFMRKRSGHLLSKHRYLAAQMLAMVEDGLWLDMAGHANRMAAELAQAVAALDDVRLIQPAETNQLFLDMPAEYAARARAAGAVFYDWPMPEAVEGRVALRLVTSWASSRDDIAALIRAMAA